ncbi:MAG TPA: hypothetical protein PLL09_04160 [Flavobacterium sp.]|uniref:hypothetical protein n=1 Tax=unclassified Flavobacterium TaxID=196869 RepID=UPI0025BFE741|nr:MULTISPECIES: hypothetical protein [unclassified Flavobacterium]HRE77001.1 hypothetical protein [Flavobacterium sp.]
MTQLILLLIAVFIGVYYIRKYSKKAKLDIQKYSQIKNKADYLTTNIFTNLKNRNDGFDVESIYYFSESDFEIVINRIEKLGVGIFGIEPWLDGEMYDVKSVEDYGGVSTDSKWYKTAFEEFKKENKNLLYSATYDIKQN